MATRPIAIALTIVAALTGAASAQAATDTSARTGQVRFVKRMTPDYDKYVVGASASQQQWMNSKLWRTEVFTPFFDNMTSWYGQGWLYSDIYAIYNGSDLAKRHPDWILKNAAGQPLYIPWGCSNGSCPQYAADITNPGYRAYWITQLQTNLAKGYKGAWIDDVNLDMRVGDASGNQASPYSAALGRTLSEQDWRNAMADFTTQVRAAVPNKELVHNSIWYAAGDSGRDSNPAVQKEIASADYINLERGFNDDGLTGGNAEWSQRALQAFIDRVHAKGKGVIVDAFDSSKAGMEYSLANYLLVNSGADAVGASDMTPDNWWTGWDTDLGTATAGRYDWQGLQRRDFTGGIALVNEPSAPSKTVQLPQPMVNTAGQTVTSVTLGGGQGAVLTGVGVAAGTPDPAGNGGSQPAGSTKTATPAKTAASTKTGANTTGSGSATGSTVGTDTAACKNVRVTYATLRWNAKASKFQRRRGSAKVCIDATLKAGSKEQLKAISKATQQARRASLLTAKAARRESVKA